LTNQAAPRRTSIQSDAVRTGDGGARNTTTYVARTPTPDGANNCPPPAVVAAIHEIQGNGAITPFNGLSVISSGIVTARKSNGFFMQEPDATVDADPNTSEGIFVFTAAVRTAVGDLVTATGTATEFFNLTQISSSNSNVSISSSGNPLPARYVDDDDSLTQQALRISSNDSKACACTRTRSCLSRRQNEFGEIFTVLDGVARRYANPVSRFVDGSTDPTSGLVDCCIPRWDENPERIMVDTDGLIGSTRLNVTSNVTLTNITGRSTSRSATTRCCRKRHQARRRT
jgi:hypothetical protein